MTVSLLLVVEREAEALTAERTRLRARGLIVDGICADNVCRRCSHCFREVVGLDIVGAVSWAEGALLGNAQSKDWGGIGVVAEVWAKPRRSELASPLFMETTIYLVYGTSFIPRIIKRARTTLTLCSITETDSTLNMLHA